MTLGENIKRAREQAGMTQSDLGHACGWGKQAQTRVSNYERDYREPSFADLGMMADVLGVTPYHLLDGVYDSKTARIVTKIHQLDTDGQQSVEGIVDNLLRVNRRTEK